jgi:isocitrate lyase
LARRARVQADLGRGWLPDFLPDTRAVRGGCFRACGGPPLAIARGLAYARYADLVWCETSEPNLEEAAGFAEATHDRFPGKRLACNRPPSSGGKAKLNDATIARFPQGLGAMGYKYPLITPAGLRGLSLPMYELARGYHGEGMTACARPQQAGFRRGGGGYHAVRHQRSVGTGCFDPVAQCVAGGAASTAALAGSTEEAHFADVGRHWQGPARRW